MRKKIVLGVTDPRSSVRIMKGLPERLAREGWDVHLVTSPGPQTDIYAETSVTIHHIVMEREPSLIADLKALRAWYSLLKRISPQVVLVGTPKAGFLGIMGAWLAHIPNRVYQMRGLRLESTTGLKRLLLSTIEKLTCQLGTDILAVSHSLRDTMIDLGLVDPDKVRVIAAGSSNGVDLHHFYPGDGLSLEPLQLQIDPSLPTIGFVGRITPDKGSRELREASIILERQGVRHQLLIVGREDNQNELEKFAARASQVEIFFTGDVPDTAPYYKLMDVLCLPTYREGFPNVVLEASASAVPTVTTDATGAVDSVVDNVTGKTVPVGSGEKLAAALANLLLDEPRRLEMGKNARSYVERYFERGTVQSELIRYLDELPL